MTEDEQPRRPADDQCLRIRVDDFSNRQRIGPLRQHCPQVELSTIRFIMARDRANAIGCNN